MLLCPNQPNRSPLRGPLGTPPGVVFVDAALWVVSYANVVSTVRAFEDIAEKHGGSIAPRLVPAGCVGTRSGQSYHCAKTLPLGSSRRDASGLARGQSFRTAKTLEAGGVEPPSEKRYGPKPLRWRGVDIPEQISVYT